MILIINVSYERRYKHGWPYAHDGSAGCACYLKLEGCSDDERQFKTAKRSQAPGDATVRKRFFRHNFVIFRRRSKRIPFLDSVIFNFRDGHVTTFRHPSWAYICQMPGHS